MVREQQPPRPTNHPKKPSKLEDFIDPDEDSILEDSAMSKPAEQGVAAGTPVTQDNTPQPPKNPEQVDFEDADSDGVEDLELEEETEDMTEEELASTRRDNYRKRMSIHATKVMDEWKDFQTVDETLYDSWNPEKKTEFFKQARALFVESKDAIKHLNYYRDEMRKAQDEVVTLKFTNATNIQAYEGIEEELTRKVVEISTLERQIDRLSSNVAISREGTPDAHGALIHSHSHRRVQRLADPDKFTGDVDKVTKKLTGPDYDEWKIEIQEKLSTDSDSFPEEARKVAYIFSRTDGSAKANLRPDMMAKTLTTAAEVFEALDLYFENPHQEEDAEKEMGALMQHNTPFHQFIAEFKKYSRILEWSDSKKKKTLLKKLNTTYTAAIITTHQTMDFKGLVSALSNAAKVYESQKNERTLNPRGDDKYKGGNGQKDGSNKSAAKGATTSGTPGASKAFRTPLTQDQQKALKDSRLCFHCKEPNHVAIGEDGKFVKCEKEWKPFPNNLIVLASSAPKN